MLVFPAATFAPVSSLIWSAVAQLPLLRTQLHHPTCISAAHPPFVILPARRRREGRAVCVPKDLNFSTLQNAGVEIGSNANGQQKSGAQQRCAPLTSKATAYWTAAVVFGTELSSIVSMSVRILSHSRSISPRAAKNRRISGESQ